MELFLMEDYNELNLTKPKLMNVKHFSNKEYMEVFSTDSYDFPDVFYSKTWFISEKFKKIIEQYDPDIFGGTLVLINQDKDKKAIYFSMNPYTKNRLGKASKITQNGLIEHLIIEKKNVNPFKIFKVKDKIQEFTVISLHIVEKLLREGIVGLKFKRVRMVEDDI